MVLWDHQRWEHFFLPQLFFSFHEILYIFQIVTKNVRFLLNLPTQVQALVGIIGFCISFVLMIPEIVMWSKTCCHCGTKKVWKRSAKSFWLNVTCVRFNCDLNETPNFQLSFIHLFLFPVCKSGKIKTVNFHKNHYLLKMWNESGKKRA